MKKNNEQTATSIETQDGNVVFGSPASDQPCKNHCWDCAYSTRGYLLVYPTDSLNLVPSQISGWNCYLGSKTDCVTSEKILRSCSYARSKYSKDGSGVDCQRFSPIDMEVAKRAQGDHKRLKEIFELVQAIASTPLNEYHRAIFFKKRAMRIAKIKLAPKRKKLEMEHEAILKKYPGKWYSPYKHLPEGWEKPGRV